MPKRRQFVWLILFAATLLPASPSLGQDFFFRRTQLSDAVSVDEAGSAVQSHLERVDAFLENGQWDEAIDTLRRVVAESGDELIGLTQSGDRRDDPEDPFGSRRYLPLRHWGHMRLAQMANTSPEALRVYRAQVDPLVRAWLEKGVAQRDEQMLGRIVDEFFCSSAGDDALLALGEIALERGQHAVARAHWERISPALRCGRFQMASGEGEEEEPLLSQGRPLWIEHRLRPQVDLAALTGSTPLNRTYLAYPDSDLELANVRARLVLVSILDGAHQRAEFELAVLQRFHPRAEGVIHGKRGPYHETLTQLLEASRQWPKRRSDGQWLTVGGNFQRNKIARSRVDIAGTPVWSFALGERLEVDEDSPTLRSAGPRAAEDADGLLSMHPIVVGDVVLVSDLAPAPQQRDFPHWITRVRAYDIHTGRPAWPIPQESLRQGKRDEGVVQFSGPFAVSHSDRRRWGVPRLTISSDGRFAYARFGSPVTSRPRDVLPTEGGSTLVALDLSKQAARVWEIEPEDDFAFEGPPVVDKSFVYVAMRQALAQPQAYVACYDKKTGQLQWRTWVCAAESPSLGRSEEVTHNLLTLNGDTIYFNTNLGCVAALRKQDGQILWATRYQRADFDSILSGEPLIHFQRDVNPCILWRGLLFAAPSDCKDVLCLEAATGQLLWSRPGGDIVHLLGVGKGKQLIACGQRLWWIDAETGSITARFPASRKAEPQGHGRGALAGDAVYWPTREEIYVFDQATARPVRQPIKLDRRDAGGGNLIVAQDYLLVTTADEVTAFNQQGPDAKEKE